jgi:hypothetical protein
MPLDATPGSRRMSVAIDELLTVSLRGGPPTLPTDATPRSRRVSVAVDDMLTGCLQEILPQEQRRIHIVGSVAIEDALSPPPAESPQDVDVTATLPSRCIRVAIKTCSTPASGTAFRTTSGPSAPAYRRDSPSIIATPSV